MAKSKAQQRAKKQGQTRAAPKDFAKQKSKVGKGKKHAANATNTAFAAKRIQMPQQRGLAQRQPSSISSSHDQQEERTYLHKSLPDLLSPVTHTNAKQREHALLLVREWVAGNPDPTPSLGFLLEKTLFCLVDPVLNVRKEVLKLLQVVLRACLTPTRGPNVLRPFLALLRGQLKSCLSHVDVHIRFTGVHFVQLLFQSQQQLGGELAAMFFGCPGEIAMSAGGTSTGAAQEQQESFGSTVAGLLYDYVAGCSASNAGSFGDIGGQRAAAAVDCVWLLESLLAATTGTASSSTEQIHQRVDLQNSGCEIENDDGQALVSLSDIAGTQNGAAFRLLPPKLATQKYEEQKTAPDAAERAAIGAENARKLETVVRFWRLCGSGCGTSDVLERLDRRLRLAALVQLLVAGFLPAWQNEQRRRREQHLQGGGRGEGDKAGEEQFEVEPETTFLHGELLKPVWDEFPLPANPPVGGVPRAPYKAKVDGINLRLAKVGLQSFSPSSPTAVEGPRKRRRGVLLQKCLDFADSYVTKSLLQKTNATTTHLQEMPVGQGWQLQLESYPEKLGFFLAHVLERLPAVESGKCLQQLGTPGNHGSCTGSESEVCALRVRRCVPIVRRRYLLQANHRGSVADAETPDKRAPEKEDSAARAPSSNDGGDEMEDDDEEHTASVPISHYLPAWAKLLFFLARRVGGSVDEASADGAANAHLVPEISTLLDAWLDVARRGALSVENQKQLLPFFFGIGGGTGPCISPPILNLLELSSETLVVADSSFARTETKSNNGNRSTSEVVKKAVSLLAFFDVSLLEKDVVGEKLFKLWQDLSERDASCAPTHSGQMKVARFFTEVLLRVLPLKQKLQLVLSILLDSPRPSRGNSAGNDAPSHEEGRFLAEALVYSLVDVGSGSALEGMENVRQVVAGIARPFASQSVERRARQLVATEQSMSNPHSPARNLEGVEGFVQKVNELGAGASSRSVCSS
eukprot:g9756.t1